VTTPADAQTKFLEDMPGEIKEVLKWSADARSSIPAGHNMADFAGRFLGAMCEDGPVLPTNLSASAPEVLALCRPSIVRYDSTRTTTARTFGHGTECRSRTTCWMVAQTVRFGLGFEKR